jgi:hypothetical protein
MDCTIPSHRCILKSLGRHGLLCERTSIACRRLVWYCGIDLTKCVEPISWSFYTKMHCFMFIAFITWNIFIRIIQISVQIPSKFHPDPLLFRFPVYWRKILDHSLIKINEENNLKTLILKGIFWWNFNISFVYENHSYFLIHSIYCSFYSASVLMI